MQPNAKSSLLLPPPPPPPSMSAARSPFDPLFLFSYLF
uniref:Uncharacterized protein n=1 Tax=Rhizophora mucronata TaxID=61149 RepID=A0A2P2N0D4_RHIMU